ncbi:MAG: SagB/ThcOx family dehydrogenase, partial [Nitrospirota bacterium]
GHESGRRMDAAPALSAGQIIRQRRSALAFDAKTSISSSNFFDMLARVMPRADLPVRRRPMPWDAIPWEPACHLALFVHRVDGLKPGLYMLVRDRGQTERLRRAMHGEFAWTVPTGCPPDLPLFLLQEGDARRLAAQASCGQEIAGDGAFSLGMVAEFEESLRRHGAWFYRRLFWETGVIGQVLYLEAEAAGVRATGIGCFFDDPVHQAFGFKDLAFQSLYHFTVGGPVEDPRLTTLPPYGLDH